MEQLLWIPAVPLAAIGLFVIIGNWATPIQSWWTGRFHSAVPLIGGLFGAAAMLVCPIDEVRQWAWAPLLLDWGSAPVIALALLDACFRRLGAA